MATVREIPPHIATKCVWTPRDRKFFDDCKGNAEGQLPLLAIVNIFQVESDNLALPLKQCVLLQMICKAAYLDLLGAGFWLHRLGYELRTPNPSIAPYRVFLHLIQNEIDGTWRSDQLMQPGKMCSGGFRAHFIDESVSCRKMTPLVIHVCNGDVVQFWTMRMKGALSVPHFPREDQVQEIQSAAKTLLEYGVTVKNLVDTALAIAKPNKICAAALAAFLFRRPQSEDRGTNAPSDDSRPVPDTGEPLWWASAARLLGSVDVVLLACQLVLGGSIAEVQARKPRARKAPGPCNYCHEQGHWKAACPALRMKALRPAVLKQSARQLMAGRMGPAQMQRQMRQCLDLHYLSLQECRSRLGLLPPVTSSRGSSMPEADAPRWVRGSYPAAFKRAVVLALSDMSWLQLYQAQAQSVRGRLLAVFRNIHIGAILQRQRHSLARGRDSPWRGEGLERVWLLQAMLREERYPRSREAFEREGWGDKIAAPLQRMCGGALFDMDACWLRREWQAELAGRRLPRVQCNSKLCLLARQGSSPSTWRALLELAPRGLLTGAQLLGSVRSLAMLDVDPARVGALLLHAVDRGQVQWTAVSKALQALREALEPSQIHLLLDALRSAAPPPACTAPPPPPPAQRSGAPALALVLQPRANPFALLADEDGDASGVCRQLLAVKHVTTHGAQSKPPLHSSARTAAPTPDSDGEGWSTVTGRPRRNKKVRRQWVRVGSEAEGWEGVKVAVRRSFKDKHGQVTEIVKLQPVSPSFSSDSLLAFRRMLQGVLVHAVDAAVASARQARSAAQTPAPPHALISRLPWSWRWPWSSAPPESRSERRCRVAVLLYTPALALNGRRTGLPPAAPCFSRSGETLWRNEAVSLAEAAGGDAPQMLLVGLSWRPQRGGRFAALDLTVMMFDAGWRFLEDCSWQNLRAGGCRHSGDWFGHAAGSGGGVRETVEICLPQVREAGRARYLVVCALAYCGRDMSSFPDAAMYVADPGRRGDGPGGCALLTAQRLGGEGKCNVGMVLEVREDGDVIAVNVDHTLHTSHVVSATGAESVAAQCQRVLRQREAALPLSSVALLTAAATADKVAIVHAPPPPQRAAASRLRGRSGAREWAAAEGGRSEGAEAAAGEQWVARQEGESCAQFLERLEGVAAGLQPTPHPQLSSHSIKELAKAGGVAVLCGELQDAHVWGQAVLGAVGDVADGAVKVANLRSSQSRSEEVQVEVEGEERRFTLALGWDVLEALA